MTTDEKTPFMSYPEMPYPEIVETKPSVKDAVAAANAASLEAARAKKRTADAATEAVNSSLVYVARKLMKHGAARLKPLAARRTRIGINAPLVHKSRMKRALLFAMCCISAYAASPPPGSLGAPWGGTELLGATLQRKAQPPPKAPA